MNSKIIFDDGQNCLVARYNPFYKTNDYYIRTFIQTNDGIKEIDIELNIAEFDMLAKTKDFNYVIEEYEENHDMTYETLLKNVICSYIIEEYGLLTPGISKIASDLCKFPYLAEEFYENVIVKGRVPEDGIKIKGYSAYDIQQEKNISDIQAYCALVEISQNIKHEVKPKEPPKKKIRRFTDETMVMGPFDF